MSSPAIDAKRPSDVYKAVGILLAHTAGDRQKQVFVLAQELLECALGPYATKHPPAGGDLATVLDAVMPHLLLKCSDSAPRTRDAAVALAVWLAALPLNKNNAALYGPLLKPMPAKVAFKEAQGRLEVRGPWRSRPCCCRRCVAWLPFVGFVLCSCLLVCCRLYFPPVPL